MVDTKSRGYSNSCQLSECGYSELFLATSPAQILYKIQAIWVVVWVIIYDTSHLMGGLGYYVTSQLICGL